mmetsp:Transcript_19637/g.49213  ORF Transcript_19637/g.49213 Transcript_19637/m.49213 type:complete len:86 (-) Transcript_19637:289-546(-)|eukprot:CAMPEP_0173437766 /NCGR_PEP_ID=MMETSP1357-20121228/18349_1 /TAXON_ID=77926 /ORGANISM="Hemiselmis rufescens, Strain PCC563" /LENGTH=85 /DNA_ID=CAMNT_0014402967 /DNA_START=199 /DNA_END=456 /DNA_ORIENTATION=+
MNASAVLRRFVPRTVAGVRSFTTRPTEGSWAYIAKRREVQAGKEVARPFQKVARAVPPSGREPWQEVAKCNKGHFSHIHHGQTKL